MAVRKVVHIDEEKCNGCGVCVPSCAEGAIQIIDGKARLVSDVYCDGLGACLGECPQDAIHIIERDAAEFDEAAAMRHVAKLRGADAAKGQAHAAAHTVSTPNAHSDQPVHSAADSHGSHAGHGGCHGAAVRSLGLPVVNAAQHNPAAADGRGSKNGEGEPSGLRNWPLQLHLAPPSAPFLREADILLVADCVPFALADFHRRFLGRRPVVIGCPKLDDTHAYLQKLIDMLHVAKPQRITVVRMEVPCCMGLVKLADVAIQTSGAATPLEEVVVSIRGEVLSAQLVGAAR